jgi:4-amino-4-deoxy-L-arabinose transferase-like glycosyltransferase
VGATRAFTRRVPTRWAPDLLLLLVVSGWLTVVGLAQVPLQDPDEPRSALVARVMVDRGDWLVPHLPLAYQREYPLYPVQGEVVVYLNKPPLFFWLEAAAISLLGPTDLAVRLPSVLAQVLTVLLVYLIGRSLWGRRAGLLGGLVMATAVLAVILGRVARMDPVLIALMTAMLLAASRLMSGSKRAFGWLALLYVSAGLGILTKGPVAVVIPATVLLATIALTGRWGDVRELHPLAGAVVALLIAAPWFLYMNYRFPPTEAGAHGFLYEFFVRQNIERATAENFEGTALPGYLLAVLLGGFVPWTFFLPGACARPFRFDWRERKNRPVGILLVLWSAGVVLLFSLSRTQFLHYVLPAFPPLAVLTGSYLDDRLHHAEPGRFFRLTVALTLGVCLVLAGKVTLGSGPGGPGWPLRISVMVVATAGLLAALLALLRRRAAAAVGLLMVETCVVLTFGLATDPFSIYMAHSTKGEARVLKDLLRPGDRIVALQAPYSLQWYLWPEPVLDASTNVAPAGGAQWQALVAALNGPQRTFCVMGDGGASGKPRKIDRLRLLVRWPLRVIMETPRHVLFVTEPEAGGADTQRLPPREPRAPTGAVNAPGTDAESARGPSVGERAALPPATTR